MFFSSSGEAAADEGREGGRERSEVSSARWAGGSSMIRVVDMVRVRIWWVGGSLGLCVLLAKSVLLWDWGDCLLWQTYEYVMMGLFVR